jgi:hypothetical protein
VLLKRRSVSTRLHGETSQKTAVCLLEFYYFAYVPLSLRSAKQNMFSVYRQNLSKGSTFMQRRKICEGRKKADLMMRRLGAVDWNSVLYASPLDSCARPKSKMRLCCWTRDVTDVKISVSQLDQGG